MKSERERERERERDFGVWYIALAHRQAWCFAHCERERERERERVVARVSVAQHVRRSCESLLASTGGHQQLPIVLLFSCYVR